MTWTLTSVTLLDGNGVSRTFTAYTDGTNFALAHPIVDNTGAIVAPATSGNQTTANTSLSTIVTNTGHIPSQGSAVSASSLPVVIASDQATFSVFNSTNPIVASGATITRPANTTAYSAGQLLANSVTAGSVVPSTIAAARASGKSSKITGCRLLKSGTSVTNASFTLHLYTTSPTVSNGDGGTFLSNQSATWVGSINVTSMTAFSDGAIGLGTVGTGSSIVFLPTTSTNLYCLIQVQAAYTPASAEVFTPILYVE